MDDLRVLWAQIWQLLFTRLQSSKTAKFSRAFIIFLSFFITQQGAEVVAKSVDAVQKGLFLLVMQSIWLPSMASVSGQHEEKLVAVATTKVRPNSKLARSARHCHPPLCTSEVFHYV